MPTYSYSGTNTETFTATTGGSYQITAYGGQGGPGNAQAGGLGAKVSGVFQLVAGETLTIVVGGEGYQGEGSEGAGGGGGSFVIENFNGVHQKLLIAGGGGGAGYGYASYAAGAPGVAGTGGNGHGGAGSTAKGYGGGGGGGYTGGAGGGVKGGNPETGKAGAAGSSASGNYGYGSGYVGHFTPTYTGNGGFGGGGGGGYFGGGGGGGGFGGGAGGKGGSGTYTTSAGQTGGSNGGGGGGSYDGGSQPMLESAENTGDGSVIITPLCFLRGTRILTPTGEVRVEDLQLGDAVVTRFGGIQPVKWIGRHSPAPDNEVNTPVCIHAGALGERLPARDLYVSPGHSLLVDGSLLIASLLVNGVTVTQSWCPPRIDYFHVELATHDCVIAEGAWAETYADAQISRDRFANAAEYDLLYPEAGPAPDAFTLCAPRPEQGAKLEAALRPVLARVAVTPGPLQGSIDRIDGAWRVQGWAHDPAHPDLPVLLEVELDGQVIGTVAACEQRDDLAQAGFARGRCAFTFTSPVRLRPERLHSLRIRRAADGASLAMDARCAAAIPPATQQAKRSTLRLVAV